MKTSQPADPPQSTLETEDAEGLLHWYDGIKRDLPWRLNRDPYRIWVSEIMLQQTQVKTVVPYYERFMARFPTVDELAAADIEDVLAHWSGLGYYRRARQLHAAAIEVVARGGFPSTAEGLESLPGIGPYTAAAVASMAFDEVVPVLDGNVERVLCRRLAIEEDAKRAPVRRRLLAAAADLLHSRRPGDSNQAMMELGALVCRPQQPSCTTCPLRNGCRGRELGPERFPVPRKRRKTERHDLAVVVVERRGRILLFRRPSSRQVMAGMWELPMVPAADPGSVAERLSTTYGGQWTLHSLHQVVRHSITHRALHLQVYAGKFSAGGSVAEGPEAVWADVRERADLALSSMVDKVLTAYGDAQGRLDFG